MGKRHTPSKWRILTFAAALLLCAVTVSPLGMAQDLVAPPGTSLGIASVPNLRDVGGYATADGSLVRRGIAYRANQLNPISADDMQKIAALGLKNDFDLRTIAEREAKPDELPPNVKVVSLNVLGDGAGTVPINLEQLFSDPKQTDEMLGGGRAADLLLKAYREFITLPSANAAYRELFLNLGDPKQLPSIYHCTAGKDRTGWASAALLTLLGVPQQAVYADYLKSNEYVLPVYKPYIDQFVASGGDPAILQDLMGVKAEYLKASFDEVNTRYGGIEGYFEKGLGIDPAQQQKIRDRFLVTKK
jgi:protein-tyrosine phosphatase